MAQQVKDPALSLLWLWLQLWRWFDPWPGNFHMPQGWQKKKKKKKKSRISLASDFTPTALEARRQRSDASAF